MMKFAALTTLALLFGISQASASTVYNVDATIGTGSVSGFIQTDGVVGTVADANIQDWNLVISTDGVHSFNLLGPLSGNNSAEGIFGTAFTATATGLFFDFNAPITEYVLIQNPFLGSGTNFICLNGCSDSVVIGVGDLRANETLTGNIEIGSTTPLPATLPLFATGLGALGLFGWRRKRKAVALAAA